MTNVGNFNKNGNKGCGKWVALQYTSLNNTTTQNVCDINYKY